MGNACECLRERMVIDSADGKKSFLNNKGDKPLNPQQLHSPMSQNASQPTFKEKQDAMILKREKKKLDEDIIEMNNTDPKQADEKMIFERAKETSKIRKDSMNNTLTLKDFTVEKLLGTGGFGRVLLVKRANKEGKYYAMKILNKGDIIKSKLQDNINLERDILNENRHPFIVELKWAFETKNQIYFVMEYLSGGQLFSLLKKYRRFPEDVATFYLAEVVLGIIYLHDEMDVIYRDLKPENILLTADGNIKLTDFGLSKKTDKKTYTFAGTAEYLAPEILQNLGHDKSVDWWSVGILLYEMLRGYTPFYSKNVANLQKMIIENKPTYPTYFSADAIDLIQKLLTNDSKSRLGANNHDEIKQHPFFKKINWDDLYNLKIPPPSPDSIMKNTYRLG